MTQRKFVSSIYRGLKDYRAPVQNAIHMFCADDESMQNFGVRDERPKEECLRIVREESDWFVGIYAHRYGFAPSGDDGSITEAEFVERNNPAVLGAGWLRFAFPPYGPVLANQGSRP